MPLFETAVFGGVLPGLIMLAVLCYARRLTGKHRAETISILGITTAFIVGYLLLMGLPQFPATEVAQWLFWLVVITGLSVTVIVELRLNPGWKYSFYVLLSVTVAILILNPFNSAIWSEGHPWLWVISIVLLYLFMFHIIERQVRVENIRQNLFLMAAMAFFSVPTYINSDSLKLLQIAILLTALVGAVWFASLFNRTINPQDSIVAFIITIVISLFLAGNRFASLPDLSAAFLVSAWTAPWMIQWNGDKPRPGLVFVVRLCAVVVLALLALYQTFDLNTTAASSSNYGY